MLHAVSVARQHKLHRGGGKIASWILDLSEITASLFLSSIFAAFEGPPYIDRVLRRMLKCSNMYSTFPQGININKLFIFKYNTVQHKAIMFEGLTFKHKSLNVNLFKLFAQSKTDLLRKKLSTLVNQLLD